MIDHKTKQLSSPFFENLNGLRFVGALAVFLFHSFTLGREHWGDFFSSPTFEKVSKVFAKGHHGVGLFFVLSGFLITYLLLHEAKTKQRINAFGFFMRRLLRIWPLYFLIVVFGFFVFPHLPFGIETTNSITHYGLFLSNFEEIWNGWQDPVSFLSVTWSVSIEEQFYISWVILIGILPFMRKGKYFGAYFGILLLASIVFRILNIDAERTMYFHTLSVVSDLALGGFLSYYCFHSEVPNKLREMPKWTILLFYILGLSIILGSRSLFAAELVVIERLVIGLFFAFIIFEQVYCKHSFYKADKIPGFFKLGEISYGLYMYHCIVIYFVQQIMATNGWTGTLTDFITFLVISAIITFCISWLSYHYFERPFLRLKKKFR